MLKIEKKRIKSIVNSLKHDIYQSVEKEAQQIVSEISDPEDQEEGLKVMAKAMIMEKLIETL